MSTMMQDEIVQLVQTFLDRHQPEAYRLDVDALGVKREDDWWYVTVVPSRTGVRSYDYAQRLTEVEERIRDERDLKVLLIPTLVDD